MKRALCLILAAVFVLLPVFAYADGENISVYVDGKAVNFDVPPTTINDRTMIPLRATFEMLGASVLWDEYTQTVTGEKNGVTVRLTIGSNVLYKNGVPISLDVPPMLINDRTLVPVRAISEAFGCKVDWDDNTQSVIISSGAYENYNAPSVTEAPRENIPPGTACYAEEPWCPDFGKISGASLIISTESSRGNISGHAYIYSALTIKEGSIIKYGEMLMSMGFVGSSYEDIIMFIKDNHFVSISLEGSEFYVLAGIITS